MEILEKKINQWELEITGKMSQLHDLKNGNKTPAFTASRASGTSLRSNEIIKFDSVWLNYKGDYDFTKGVFTVPESGLYVVTGSVMASSGQQLHCHLWKNNQSNVGVYGIKYSQGAFHAVMQLKNGDRLYIKHDDTVTEGIYGGHWSMFSAYKISDH